MSISVTVPSNVTARTQLIQAEHERYAYRRFGAGAARRLVFLQHFAGTLDSWDPVVTNTLAAGREVILFDTAGIGRSTGTVPATIEGTATHALDVLDGLGVTTCDALGLSLGGIIAPRGRHDVMHLVEFTLPTPQERHKQAL